MTFFSRFSRFDLTALSAMTVLLAAILGLAGYSAYQEGRPRMPRIVYMAVSDLPRQLWVVQADGASPRRIEGAQGNLFDFAVAPDGSGILYTVLNEAGGSDFWWVHPDGGLARMVLECGVDRCMAPAWSPNGRLVAYTRENVLLGEGISLIGAPRPWLLDIEAGTTNPLYPDDQFIGYGAVWSPDGKWLSSYDGIEGIVRVYNIETGEIIPFETATGLVGAWSSDARYFYYTTVYSTENVSDFRTLLMRADFTTSEVGVWMGKNDAYDYAYNLPAYSPIEDRLLLGLKGEPGEPDMQLWLISPELMAGPVIAQEEDYTYSNYSWSPDGSMVVMQAYQLGTTFKPEIKVWSQERGLQTVVENALLPQWLP